MTNKLKKVIWFIVFPILMALVPFITVMCFNKEDYVLILLSGTGISLFIIAILLTMLEIVDKFIKDDSND